MLRTVVIRRFGSSEVNVNDEIGLEPFCSYTIEEYLEDLETEEGQRAVIHFGPVYLFEDGTTTILQQRMERIEVEQLDELTQSLVLSQAVLRSVGLQPRGTATALVC